MEEKDIEMFASQVQLLIKAENEKLEQNIEMKIGSLEKHNNDHELLRKYDEIFNEDTMEILRDMLLRQIEKEKTRKQFNDWAMKTVVGSITIGALTFFYSVGKFVLLHIEKIF